MDPNKSKAKTSTNVLHNGVHFSAHLGFQPTTETKCPRLNLLGRRSQIQLSCSKERSRCITQYTNKKILELLQIDFALSLQPTRFQIGQCNHLNSEVFTSLHFLILYTPSVSLHLSFCGYCSISSKIFLKFFNLWK